MQYRIFDTAFLILIGGVSCFLGQDAFFLIVFPEFIVNRGAVACHDAGKDPDKGDLAELYKAINGKYH